MPYYEDIVHLCDIPRYHAKHNPNEIAFIYEDKQTTYKEFDLKTENKLSLKSDNSDFNLLCLPTDNFPTFPDNLKSDWNGRLDKMPG